VRPWRRATFVAGGIAAVELVVLLVGGAILVARPLARAVERHAQKVATATPKPAPAPKALAHKHVAAPKPKHTRAQTKVLVLNGNGRTGVAHAEATRLEGLGYRIAGAADARRHDYATTVVMYSPGYRPEGLRLARDLHVGVVGPLDGLRRTALHGGQLAVILGAR